MARASAFAQKVQPIYALLGWGWGLREIRVPSVADIERTIRCLIGQVRDVVDHECSDTDWLGRWCRTGGLQVTCGLDVLGKVVIEIAFAVDDEIDAGGGA